VEENKCKKDGGVRVARAKAGEPEAWGWPAEHRAAPAPRWAPQGEGAAQWGRGRGC